MEHYTYILYSKALDGYYIGFTSGTLQERLRKHNTNHKGYTGRANDWIIAYFETYQTKTEAYERERFIKAKKSRKYIEGLISSNV